MKHIAINFHFMCDHVISGNLIVSYISTKDQLANSLTKSLSWQLFLQLWAKIGVFYGSTILQWCNSAKSHPYDLTYSHPNIQASLGSIKISKWMKFCNNQWLVTWVNYKSFRHNLWYHFCNFLCIIFLLCIYIYSVFTVNEYKLSNKYCLFYMKMT